MTLPNWPQHANNLRKLKRLRNEFMRLTRELNDVAEEYDACHHISYYQSPIDVTYAIERRIKKIKQELPNSPSLGGGAE